MTMLALKKTFVVIILILYYVFCDQDIYSKFVQKDYEVRDVRFELSNYSTKYLNHVHCVTYKYNRSTIAVNGSINFKLDNLENGMQSLIQVYKFASNEYRPFPIHFLSEFCSGINSNALGMKKIFQECGNIKTCKFYKSITYTFCKFVVDPTKLPPFMPTGMYKAEISVFYHEEMVMVYAIFGDIYRPVKIPSN